MPTEGLARKAAVAFSALALVVVLAGCSAPSGQPAPSGPVVGKALEGLGFQSEALVTLGDARIGRGYRFAFPELANVSDEPVTVVGYRWKVVPAGVTPGKVHVYSARESGGTWLAYRDGQDDGAHLPRWHDYAGEPLRLAPHEESTFYAMIGFRVTAATETEFTGCVIDYRQSGKLYRQTLPCHYKLHFGPLTS